MLQFVNLKPTFVSLGLSLSLCIACGSDSGGNGNSAGSGNPGSAGNPASAGNGNASGSGQGGGSSGGPGSSMGGTSNPNPGGYSSGLPSDKQLGALTDAEAAALCKKLSDYFSDSTSVGKNVEDFTCRLSSALTALFTAPQTDAALQSSCKSLYATCTASPAATTETCKKPDATCTATIAEYDACINDQIAAITQIGMAFPTCDMLTLASASTALGGSEPTSPASCQSVQAKCPSAPTAPGLGDSDADPNP